MSQDLDSAPAAAAHRWIVQLVIAAVGVCVLTGALFYVTSRRVFRTAGAAGSAAALIRIDPMANVLSLEHGLSVYANQCAMCHGPKGRGDGTAATTLVPKPRDFSSGWFKIGTTRSGLPTDDDLVATLRHGMAPAAMPPWPQLTEGELRSVSLAVRHLAVEARVEERLSRTPSLSREQATRDVRAQLDPGPRIVLPPKPPTIDLARGKVFYDANCAACHDPDGRGKLREDLVDNDENPIIARDFTGGVFKGGNSLEDIAMRVARGIPGTPMPANPAVSPDDLWSVSAYVRAFSARVATTGRPD